MLDVNLGLNPSERERIRVVPKAVSERTGTAGFAKAPLQENTGVGRIPETSRADDSAVETIRLDDYFGSLGIYPDLVKIDVEGHEWKVLKGMRGLFEGRRPQALLVEVHGFYLSPDESSQLKHGVSAELSNAGYTLTRLESGRFVPAGDPGSWKERVHILARLPGVTPD